MNNTHRNTFISFTLMTLLGLGGTTAGCDRTPHTHSADDGHEASATDNGSKAATDMSAQPTNRVDIPASVRQNLGITFAKVELRNVAHTLRVPGQFELLPTARREYRTPLGGRIELLVTQYGVVEPGTPLYRVDSAAWRDLQEQIAAMQARVDSMGPLREAHRQHEQSLAEKVALWQQRLTQLEELRVAGGGSASQFTEARATLNATQAELADVMEKDAELQAEEKQAEAQLRSLISRRSMLTRNSRCSDAGQTTDYEGGFTVCAVASGVVETIGITPGALAEENGHVVTLVQPDQIRFRARGLQSDLGRLRDGLSVSIAPPLGGSLKVDDAMSGTLQLGLAADGDSRTIDLIVMPSSLAPWAKAGVSAYLEVVLAGGSEELAIPQSAVVRDGTRAIIFRRDPKNADKVIRMEADLGISDGRWVVVQSGVRQGDEIVMGGNFQLMLATSGSSEKAGHFHSDGTFHQGSH